MPTTDLDRDGGYCWGINLGGQLGNASTTEMTTVPVEVSGGHTWASITATTGMSHTCGVTTEDGGYCWGSNEVGQSGDGTILNRYTPVKVVTPWN